MPKTRTSGRLGSLSELLDSVNEATFSGTRLTKSERGELGRAIAETQGLPGAYAGMFALSAAERQRGFTVFTGERMLSASARHIAAEEALRALLLLNVGDKFVQGALERANANMLEALERDEAKRKRFGVYCCGKCSVALWRSLQAGGLDRRDDRLESGLKYLRKHRNAKGEWSAFPFFYTLLLLDELPDGAATKELKFARPAIEGNLKSLSRSSKYSVRRRALLERILGKI